MFVVRVNKQLDFECTPKPREGASGIGRERREGRRGRGRERVFFSFRFLFRCLPLFPLSLSLSLSHSIQRGKRLSSFHASPEGISPSSTMSYAYVLPRSLVPAESANGRTTRERKKKQSGDDAASMMMPSLFFFACTDAAAPLFSLRDMDAGAREYINKLRKRQRAWEKAIARERERVSSLLVCLSRSIAAGPSLVSPSPSLSLNPDPTNENKGSASLSLLSQSLPLLLK